MPILHLWVHWAVLVLSPEMIGPKFGGVLAFASADPTSDQQYTWTLLWYVLVVEFRKLSPYLLDIRRLASEHSKQGKQGNGSPAEPVP